MTRAANNRHNPKRDANEPDIKAALKAKGFQVWPINGSGVCDLLCCAPSGRTFLIECKVPGGTRTKAQNKFWAYWQGEKHTVYRVSDIDTIDL